MGSGQVRVRSETTVRVLPEGEYFVGRAEDSTIAIDHRSVSRQHLRIHWSDGHWMVDDCGSTFGTFVDGERITQVRIDEPIMFHLVAPDGPAVEIAPVADGQAVGRSPETRATGLLQSTHALGPRVRIGRDADNDIVVDDLGVSRQHAELRVSRDGAYELVDLKSRNGTFVNGRRVDRAQPLGNGDLVQLGRHDFRFVDGRLDEYIDRGLIKFSAQRLVVESGDGRRLVDDVDFSLDERALLAIVGPSGSGKSTLLKALTGLRPIARGCVLYEQRDLHRDGGALRRRIGYVPQADLLHDGLTVRQSLGYTERLRLPEDVSATELTARVAEVLAQLSLDHRTDSRIDTLSGGERKRVNVATELLTEPSLLLLDEPASGLDAGLERTLMLMLRGLADDGHTVIVVTHSLDSLHLCDRVLVLAPGGTPAYFGAPDGIEERFDGHELVDVFHEMSDATGGDWRDARHPRSDDGEDGQATTARAATDTRVRVSARTWFGQLHALSSRFASVLFSDRRNALLLVLQAPILGLLMAVALPTGELSLPGATEIRFVSTAALVLFVVLLGATWLGANNAIREIARETALFERETAVGVSTSAYVLSKAIVLGAITTAQAFVLVPIALSRQGGPVDAVVLGWPMGELMVAAALAGLASMSLALLVSASVRTPDRATTLLPIILILQFVLSAGGVLPEIIDKPVLREMSNVSSAQWGFAATASTADLSALQEFTNQLGDLRTVDAADPLPVIELLEEPPVTNSRWDHRSSSWLRSASVLVALIAGPLIGAIVVLRRRRPLQ